MKNIAKSQYIWNWWNCLRREPRVNGDRKKILHDTIIGVYNQGRSRSNREILVQVATLSEGGKGAYESKVHMTGPYSGFLSMKHAQYMEYCFTLPGRDASSLQGYHPSSMWPVPIYTPKWRETRWSIVPCQTKQRDGEAWTSNLQIRSWRRLTARPHTPPWVAQGKMKYHSPKILPALLVDALDDFPAKEDRSVIR